MKRLAVLALVLAGSAALPASASAAVSVSSTWSASTSELILRVRNTGDQPLASIGASMTGSDMTTPISFSADRAGNGVPLGPGFDFYPTEPLQPGQLIVITARTLTTKPTAVKAVVSADGTAFSDHSSAESDASPPAAGTPTPQATPTPPAEDPFAPDPPPAGDPGTPDPGLPGTENACRTGFARMAQNACPEAPPEPCHCAGLKLTPKSFVLDPGADAFTLKFGVDWALDCEGQGGKKCNGTFTVIKPRISNRPDAGISLELKRPTKTVACKRRGGCKDTNGHELVRLRITKSEAYKAQFKGRRGKKAPKQMPLRHLIANNGDANGRPHTLSFLYSRTCDEMALADVRFTTVTFTKNAKIDFPASDLDGNGRPDGPKRKG